MNPFCPFSPNRPPRSAQCRSVTYDHCPKNCGGPPSNSREAKRLDSRCGAALPPYCRLTLRVAVGARPVGAQLSPARESASYVDPVRRWPDRFASITACSRCTGGRVSATKITFTR